MSISPLKTEEIAKALGKDEKDASRISRVVMSFNGVYERDDTRIVKNGIHNLCRYYLLDTGKFAPWLVRALPSENPIGIYIARAKTKRWEVNDRMSIAADTGRLPERVRNVAVIRAREAESAADYVRRAKERLGAKFFLIHDETGEHDDEACLAASNIEKLPLDDQFDEYGEVVRFTGEVDNARLLDIFRWSAASGCADILSRKLSRILGIEESFDGVMPAEVLSIMSCGRKSSELSLSEYSDVQEKIHTPEIYENASYNVPFNTVDRRAFTFPDTDKMLSLFEKHSALLDELLDLQQIWRHATELVEGRDVFYGNLWTIRATWKDVRGGKGAKSRIAKREKMMTDYGIESMVEAYYAGVPLEDIIA